MTNAAAMLTALGDPTRQAIFDRLSDGPSPVGELAQGLPVSRPAVSQHLKILKHVGLVTDRREGTRRLYQVDAAGLAVLLTYLDQFWQRSLAAFEQAVSEQKGLSSRFGGDSSVRERDLDAGAAEVDHRDQGVG